MALKTFSPEDGDTYENTVRVSEYDESWTVRVDGKEWDTFSSEAEAEAHARYLAGRYQLRPRWNWSRS